MIFFNSLCNYIAIYLINYYKTLLWVCILLNLGFINPREGEKKYLFLIIFINNFFVSYPFNIRECMLEIKKCISKNILNSQLLTRLSSHLRSVQFSCSVISDSLGPHGLQYASLPCPSPTPTVYSNSCPLSQWCHPNISSSVISFSFCLLYFPATGPF